MKRLPLLALSSATLALLGASAYAATTTNKIAWSGHTWNIFHGTGNLGQSWTTNNSRASANDHLILTAYKGEAGGIGDPTQYDHGFFETRIKMSKGAGTKYAVVLIGKRPTGYCKRVSGCAPEIDFAENRAGDKDPNRTELTATVHYNDGSQEQVSTKADMSVFHTVALSWNRAYGARFYLDGKLWAHIQRVPHTAMHLAFQTFAYSKTAPLATFVARWVRTPPVEETVPTP